MKRKEKKRKIWPWVLGALFLAAALGIVFVISAISRPGAANIQSVNAERGSISQTVVGTGTLQYDGDEAELRLPAGVEISEIFVESGDETREGDALITLDPVSLLNKIASVQDDIKSLDTKINNGKDGGDQYIKSGVSGRVKKIYADTGGSVTGLMNGHGALMLISLDGKMAVDIETAANLSAGDSVTVALEGGAIRTGTVSASEGGVCTVTLSDNGPAPGERAEVKDADGNVLGSGGLYINQPLSVTGSYGTIKTIHVSENSMVYSGTYLFTLENVPPTAEYLQMLKDREELVETLNTLIALSATHTVSAPVSGTVMSVNAEKGAETAALDGESFMTALTIAPSDSAALEIGIDELDILSVQNGQEAAVVFDALPGREFSGTVTKISHTPSSQGAAAKYTATLSLPRDGSMRIGMNATATIGSGISGDILVLPLAALQESGGRVFVYTARDEKTGALTGEAEVTTGVSDGEMVEIVSGLDEGAAVFYTLNSAESDDNVGRGLRRAF